MHLGDTVRRQNSGQARGASGIRVLEFGAVGNNAGHHGDRDLISSPDVAALDGAGVDVVGHTDAHGHESLQTEAFLADIRVPGVEVVGGEVVEAGDDGAAGLVRLDGVVRDTWIHY